MLLHAHVWIPHADETLKSREHQTEGRRNVRCLQKMASGTQYNPSPQAKQDTSALSLVHITVRAVPPDPLPYFACQQCRTIVECG